MHWTSQCWDLRCHTRGFCSDLALGCLSNYRKQKACPTLGQQFQHLLEKFCMHPGFVALHLDGFGWGFHLWLSLPWLRHPALGMAFPYEVSVCEHKQGAETKHSFSVYPGARGLGGGRADSVFAVYLPRWGTPS